MFTTFKCCSTKEVKNFICLNCVSVFHPSCIERTKSHSIVSGYRIFCCKDCESEAEEKSQNTEILKARIEEQEKLLLEKERFILRQKRKTQDFENDVFETEQNYEIQLNDNKLLISSLTKEVKNAKKLNGDLEMDLQRVHKELEKYKGELANCSELLKSMKTSIEVLTEENNLYCNELKGLRQEVFVLKERNINSQQVEVKMDAFCEQKNGLPEETGRQCSPVAKKEASGKFKNTSTSEMRKPRILILGDENSSQLHNYIRRSLNNESENYEILNIFKPGASMTAILEDVEVLTKD